MHHILLALLLLLLLLVVLLLLLLLFIVTNIGDIVWAVNSYKEHTAKMQFLLVTESHSLILAYCMIDLFEQAHIGVTYFDRCKA